MKKFILALSALAAFEALAITAPKEYVDRRDGEMLVAASNLVAAATNNVAKGLATVARSGSYEDLSNKPTIPAPVTIDATLSTQGAAADAKAAGNAIAAKYTKPSSGIPKTHLAADVRTSLGKADNAVSNAVAEVTAVVPETFEWQYPETITISGNLYYLAPSTEWIIANGDTAKRYYVISDEPRYESILPAWFLDGFPYSHIPDYGWEPEAQLSGGDFTASEDATELHFTSGFGDSTFDAVKVTTPERNKYGLARLVDIGNAATPGIVTNIVRDLSLGGIWDSQLEVWWTPRMRNGSLTYEATTNVNLNAGN